MGKRKQHARLWLVQWPTHVVSLVSAHDEEELWDYLDQHADPSGCRWRPYDGQVFITFDLPRRPLSKEPPPEDGPEVEVAEFDTEEIQRRINEGSSEVLDVEVETIEVFEGAFENEDSLSENVLSFTWPTLAQGDRELVEFAADEFVAGTGGGVLSEAEVRAALAKDIRERPAPVEGEAGTERFYADLKKKARGAP